MIAFSPPELTVVIPTFNERGNLPELLMCLETALAGIAWEIIVVDDDSPDGTAEVAKQFAQSDPRIRCIRRVNRRGLAGACIEGMLASAAPYVAVMDADLQHDEAILPQMLKEIKSGNYDVVVGSRLTEGGSSSAGFSKLRASVSQWANWMARGVIKTELKDIMSGFFMLRRETIDKISQSLSPSGFKILADIIVSSPVVLRVKEVPYRFRSRRTGDSKFDMKVGLEFVSLLVNKLTRGLLPPSFVFFSIVGASGVLIHLAVLRAGIFLWPSIGFGGAQIIATIIAMTSNFFVNNVVTYRHARLKGAAILRGLGLFYLVCSLGAVVNVGIAVWLFSLLPIWWLAGLSGILMSAVWNYTFSSLFVWRGAA